MRNENKAPEIRALSYHYSSGLSMEFLFYFFVYPPQKSHMSARSDTGIAGAGSSKGDT